jgi:hypothetical protein
MKEERRILQKEVFPKLEKYCEENGAKFQAVDLRWGVNEGSQLNQKTLEICLNEIARCQRISPKPNFLILLGNKYGWQPIPEKIPEGEMEQIKKILDQPPGEELEIDNRKYKAKDFVDLWYKLDNNAIPPEYVLQPREKLKQIEGETNDELKAREYNNWKVKEDVLRTILRNAVNKVIPGFTEEQKRKYFFSATHQEIMNGALNPLEGTEKPEEHVFALVRDIKGLPGDKTAEGFIDLVDGKSDDYCIDQLDNLKEKLKNMLGSHLIPYEAKWENGKLIMDKSVSVEFENKVFTFLKDIIEQQIKEVITPDEINHEVKLHKEFKERLTEYFRGRTDILIKIKLYLSGTEEQVMSIIGESGSGKSSVMAEGIRQYESEYKKALIVYRFIGTTSNSSNIISLLQSICGQIAREYNVTLQSLAGEGKDKALYEMNGLTEIFRKCLALGTSQKPIVLFLDALDQLSDSDNARELYWIPRDLPSNAKIVVSALKELEGRLNGTYPEQLTVLPIPEAEQILDLWFKSIRRRLSVEQYKEVVNKFSHTGLAIYLKLAFEKARHWHSYDKAEVCILKGDVKGIINSFIDGLEAEHTKDFVQHVICYMLCGKYGGLAENEILEILVFDKEYWKIFLDGTHKDHRKELEDYKKELEDPNNKVKGAMKIPIVVWSRLFLDLEPYLTERDADGIPIITFFHRQFNEVLRERYKLDEEVAEEK